MSTRINNAAMGGMNKLNTALQTHLGVDGTRCFLLKRAGETSRFTSIIELTNGFYADWSEYRQAMRFSYATTTDINNAAAQVTHIGYGVPDSDSRLEVYAIDDPTRDIVAPSNGDWFWKFYAVKVRTERFTIPTP